MRIQGDFIFFIKIVSEIKCLNLSMPVAYSIHRMVEWFVVSVSFYDQCIFVLKRISHFLMQTV